MRRTISLLICLSFTVFLLAGCTLIGSKDIQEAEDPRSENYDWDVARKEVIEEIELLLETITVGTTSEYLRAKDNWSNRAKADAHAVMFPSQEPPSNCSASVTYIGYSAPQYNSEGAEYLSCRVRRMNNSTLATEDIEFLVMLGRGNQGYHI